MNNYTFAQFNTLAEYNTALRSTTTPKVDEYTIAFIKADKTIRTRGEVYGGANFTSEQLQTIIDQLIENGMPITPATHDTIGGLKVDGDFSNETRKYAVKLTEDGHYGYVEVPWTDTETPPYDDTAVRTQISELAASIDALGGNAFVDQVNEALRLINSAQNDIQRLQDLLDSYQQDGPFGEAEASKIREIVNYFSREDKTITEYLRDVDTHTNTMLDNHETELAHIREALNVTTQNPDGSYQWNSYEDLVQAIRNRMGEVYMTKTEGLYRTELDGVNSRVTAVETRMNNLDATLEDKVTVTQLRDENFVKATYVGTLYDANNQRITTMNQTLENLGEQTQVNQTSLDLQKNGWAILAQKYNVGSTDYEQIAARMRDDLTNTGNLSALDKRTLTAIQGTLGDTQSSILAYVQQKAAEKDQQAKNAWIQLLANSNASTVTIHADNINVDGLVPKLKAKNVFADYGEFGEVKTTVADIKDLYAKKAEITSLVAGSLTTDLILGKLTEEGTTGLKIDADNIEIDGLVSRLEANEIVAKRGDFDNLTTYLLGGKYRKDEQGDYVLIDGEKVRDLKISSDLLDIDAIVTRVYGNIEMMDPDSATATAVIGIVNNAGEYGNQAGLSINAEHIILGSGSSSVTVPGKFSAVDAEIETLNADKLSANQITTPLILGKLNEYDGTTQMKIASEYITLDSGTVIKAVNGNGNDASSLTISADKINLDGYVTATELETEKATITNLIGTKASLDEITTGYILGKLDDENSTEETLLKIKADYINIDGLVDKLVANEIFADKIGSEAERVTNAYFGNVSFDEAIGNKITTLYILGQIGEEGPDRKLYIKSDHINIEGLIDKITAKEAYADYGQFETLKATALTVNNITGAKVTVDGVEKTVINLIADQVNASALKVKDLTVDTITFSDGTQQVTAWTKQKSDEEKANTDNRLSVLEADTIKASELNVDLITELTDTSGKTLIDLIESEIKVDTLRVKNVYANVIVFVDEEGNEIEAFKPSKAGNKYNYLYVESEAPLNDSVTIITDSAIRFDKEIDEDFIAANYKDTSRAWSMTSPGLSPSTLHLRPYLRADQDPEYGLQVNAITGNTDASGCIGTYMKAKSTEVAGDYIATYSAGGIALSRGGNYGYRWSDNNFNVFNYPTSQQWGNDYTGTSYAVFKPGQMMISAKNGVNIADINVGGNSYFGIGGSVGTMSFDGTLSTYLNIYDSNKQKHTRVTPDAIEFYNGNVILSRITSDGAIPANGMEFVSLDNDVLKFNVNGEPKTFTGGGSANITEAQMNSIVSQVTASVNNGLDDTIESHISPSMLNPAPGYLAYAVNDNTGKNAQREIVTYALGSGDGRTKVATILGKDIYAPASSGGPSIYVKSISKNSNTFTVTKVENGSESSFTMTDNTGTGTAYTFAEGSTNGAFSVTPSGSSAQSVKIHGLGSNAYTSTSIPTTYVKSITKNGNTFTVTKVTSGTETYDTLYDNVGEGGGGITSDEAGNIADSRIEAALGTYGLIYNELADYAKLTDLTYDNIGGTFPGVSSSALNSYVTKSSVSTSNNPASWGSTVVVGTVGGTDLKFTMPAQPGSTATWSSISGDSNVASYISNNSSSVRSSLGLGSLATKSSISASDISGLDDHLDQYVNDERILKEGEVSWSSISNKPTIPTAYSSTNTGGYLTKSSADDLYAAKGSPGSVTWSAITNKPSFATVATTGSYNDLSDKPTIITSSQVDSAIVQAIQDNQLLSTSDVSPETISGGTKIATIGGKSIYAPASSSSVTYSFQTGGTAGAFQYKASNASSWSTVSINGWGDAAQKAVCDSIPSNSTKDLQLPTVGAVKAWVSDHANIMTKDQIVNTIGTGVYLPATDASMFVQTGNVTSSIANGNDTNIPTVGAIKNAAYLTADSVNTSPVYNSSNGQSVCQVGGKNIYIPAGITQTSKTVTIGNAIAGIRIDYEDGDESLFILLDGNEYAAIANGNELKFIRQ